jgi:uncharacterized protein YdaU (DUF1376 family)
MSKAPSMPLFWDAYIADTTHLTTEEHGAYFLLLGAMWRHDCFIPDDDADNARIVGLSLSKWKKVKIRLCKFLIIEDNQISQGKLQEVWTKTMKNIEVKKSNGARGGRPKKEQEPIKNKDLAKATGSNSLKLNESIHIHNHSIEETNVSLYHQIQSIHPAGFADLWACWPFKVGKASAEKSYPEAAKEIGHALLKSKMIEHANFYQEPGGPYVPHLSTWLKEKRWHDDIDQYRKSFNRNESGKGRQGSGGVTSALDGILSEIEEGRWSDN